MARNDDFVDISSSSQVQRAYGSSRQSTDRAERIAAERSDRERKRRRKGRGRRIFVLVLSIIMLIVGTGFVGYYNIIDSLNFEEIIPAVAPTAPTTAQDATVTVKDAGNSLLSSSSVLNILLFGQDYHGDEEEGDPYGRSDTTILMSIDTVHKKIKLTSFQRDTYVSIPGFGDNKINSAFSSGGVPLSIKTIEANFGIKVDKYAVVDFDSFRDIIYELGGVDIELTLEEIEYINAQIIVNDQFDDTDLLEYDPYQEKQMMHLDEYQALWYARDRGEENLGGNPDFSFSGDDWDRTSRQRNLIETIIKSLREDASFTELVAIVNKVGPLVTTNLKKSDITFLVSNMMNYLQYDMEELSLPTQPNWGYGTTDNGQSVIVINNWDQVRYDLASFVYEDAVSSSNPSDN